MVHGEAAGDGVRGNCVHCRGEISGKESAMSMSMSEIVELVLMVERCCWWA